MKDVKTIFIERLDDIQNNLNDKNYSVCEKIAHDLVNFTWNLELEDEVFISEVLEGVFSNLESITSNYDLPEDVRITMHSNIVSRMKSLLEKYPTKDPSKLYEALKQLRYITTFHQLTAWLKYDKRNISKRTYYTA